MTIIDTNQPYSKSYSKIGHSNVISETVFSRGFALPEEQISNSEQYLQNVVLCDNPGFNDTRGTSYEICTNLSMDRAISVCRSIKAIVLVVPFETIFADRGARLTTLISELLEKYPMLLKDRQIFERFFLLITKSDQA